MFCSQCGKKSTEGSGFCSKCGVLLQTQGQSPINQGSQSLLPPELQQTNNQTVIDNTINLGGQQQAISPPTVPPKVTMVEAFKDYWKRAFQFRGVSTRAQYWLVILFNFIIGLAIGIAAAFEEAIMWVSLAYVAISIIPSISIVVRRLHDTNRSGWHYWIVVIPILGWILFFVWLCEASKPSRFRSVEQNPLDVGIQGGN